MPQEAGREETRRLDASGGDWKRVGHEACVRARAQSARIKTEMLFAGLDSCRSKRGRSLAVSSEPVTVVTRLQVGLAALGQAACFQATAAILPSLHGGIYASPDASRPHVFLTTGP